MVNLPGRIHIKTEYGPIDVGPNGAISMRNQTVYDLPLRFFHWLFAGLFIVAFLIAKTIDDESLLFSYHMLAGLLLAFIVSLRIIWGFIGSKHSRFSNFALHPRDLIAYFTGILSGDKRKWAGHNPASSWAAILMILLALGLAGTGYLMASGQKETFEDVHEIMANGFLIVVLLHIAGVILHALRHRDGIAMAMIDGSKSHIPETETISCTYPLALVIFLGLVSTFVVFLIANFERQSRTLNLFGTSLQFGENAENEYGKHGKYPEHGQSRGEREDHEDGEND